MQVVCCGLPGASNKAKKCCPKQLPSVISVFQNCTQNVAPFQVKCPGDDANETWILFFEAPTESRVWLTWETANFEIALMLMTAK